MNEELLGRILDMVSNAGEGGFVLAIIYLMYPYFVAVGWWIVLITLARLGYRLISTTMAAHTIAEGCDYSKGGKDHNWNFSSATRQRFITAMTQAYIEQQERRTTGH